jgi:hypothetical protein
MTKGTLRRTSGTTTEKAQQAQEEFVIRSFIAYAIYQTIL